MTRGKTFDQGQRARELFDKGISCNAIAKNLGVAPSTISAWAKREGLSFDRSKTEDAVAAHKIDRAARRAAIIDRLYTRTEKLLDRLENAQFKTLITGEYGSQRTTELDFVPTIDEKNIAASLNTYLERASRLETVDDSDGLGPVESMLGRLAQRFGLTDA